MTAEHSAGTAVFSSLRQLATSASRSTVRMPLAAASAAALLASDERMESAGSDFGSGAMFMASFYAPADRGSTGAKSGLRYPVGQIILFYEVAEAGELPFELQFDGARRSMALLCDDDFGFPEGQLHFELPFFMFGGARLGLLVLQVIFLAVDEQNDVGVLFDRTGFAQVRQLRVLVVTAFDLARQLRQRNHGNIQLLGERLQAGGDLGHFLHAVIVAALARSLQQLDVVDHDHVEPFLPLEPARPRRQLRNRQAARLVDKEWQMFELDRVVANPVELVLFDSAAADHARRNSGLLGEDTRGQLLGGHFAGEKADNTSIDRLLRAVNLDVLFVGACDVVGNIGSQRGLAHAGASGDDDQVGP